MKDSAPSNRSFCQSVGELKRLYAWHANEAARIRQELDNTDDYYDRLDLNEDLQYHLIEKRNIRDAICMHEQCRRANVVCSQHK